MNEDKISAYQLALRKLRDGLKVIEDQMWKRLKCPNRMNGIYPTIKSGFPPEAPRKD